MVNIFPILVFLHVTAKKHNKYRTKKNHRRTFSENRRTKGVNVALKIHYIYKYIYIKINTNLFLFGWKYVNSLKNVKILNNSVPS